MQIFWLWEENAVTAENPHRHGGNSTTLSGFSMKQFYSLPVNATNILKPQQSVNVTLQHVFSAGTNQHSNNVF